MTCCGPRRDVLLNVGPVTAYSPLAPEPCSEARQLVRRQTQRLPLHMQNTNESGELQL